MLKGKEIILGVTGSIACYKAVEIAGRLKKLGCNVSVVMTREAKEFVAPLTFRTITQNRVYTDMFDAEDHKIGHVSLAARAGLILIAPATANIISKIACGIADDLLSATVLAARSKVLVAPAMNEGMYRNAVIQENISRLKKRGFFFIGPAKGSLACGEEGEGRMCEPAEIAGEAVKLCVLKNDLNGKKVLITAGPTREFIDPVRFISNPSSGKMGFALAAEAAERGADVTLVSGPVSLDAPEGIKLVKVTSAGQMDKEVNAAFAGSDIIVMSAAVSDWSAVSPAGSKIRSGGDLELKLRKTTDIIAGLGRKKGRKTLVGFALETENLAANAKKKMEAKNLDMIVANRTDGTYPFNSDRNTATIMARAGRTIKLPELTKNELAEKIFDEIIKISTKK